jgi:hypothetical protein
LLAAVHRGGSRAVFHHLTNNLDWDYKAPEDFAAFRQEAEVRQFRYSLEVFNPNVDAGIPAREIGAFLNDHIVRTLAGVPSAGRPLFLRIPYKGPGPLEELVAYDPNLIVGILGGRAGDESRPGKGDPAHCREKMEDGLTAVLVDIIRNCKDTDYGIVANHDIFIWVVCPAGRNLALFSWERTDLRTLQGRWKWEFKWGKYSRTPKHRAKVRYEPPKEIVNIE